MNRKQKIIVSVTGIFLVLLLLVGLTYAYFLTQIQGNENTKSISVTTANLRLVYGDGNGVINATNIEPGYTLDEKTFTVSNEGNAETDYAVVIEDVVVKDINTGKVTTFESNDFTYTLSCTSDGEPCDGINVETTFPIEGGLLIGNIIEVGKTHTYSLIVTYKDTGLDQSNDMNKMMSAKVNITTLERKLLADEIIDNAKNVTEQQKEAGYAEYRATPLTTPAQEISAENESVLSLTLDEYGTSYYFRGAVKNNYLTFNNMCWRIVRIEGDGAIKLVLEDKDNKCENSNGNWNIGAGEYGITTNNVADYENSGSKESMKYIFDIFLNGGSFKNYYNFSYSGYDDYETLTYTAWSDEVKGKLKTTTVCIGDTINAYTSAGVLMTETEKQNAITNYGSFYYDNYKRLGIDRTVSLICNANGGRTNETQIFPLTADEVIFAGGKVGESNYSYYLMENSSFSFSTLSVATFDTITDTIMYVSSDGSVYYKDAGRGPAIVGNPIEELRPAVSLASGTKILSGDGSINNPYVVE